MPAQWRLGVPDVHSAVYVHCSPYQATVQRAGGGALGSQLAARLLCTSCFVVVLILDIQHLETKQFVLISVTSTLIL